LAVVGNELRITIPEGWLGEAAYPVVVDPTIGTTTVGSQTHWDNVDNESYDQLIIEFAIMVNRFLLPETFNGNATAYVYAYDSNYWRRCKPVFYSDNNNFPVTRRSKDEGTFDIEVRSGKPAGWRSVNISTNTSLASGSYIWYGLFCEWFAPRFDYGAKSYWDWWDHLGNDIPNTYPGSPIWYQDFKLSMFFTYTNAQNYIRTLTQGVSLTDSRKLSADYKRNAIQTVQANAMLKGIRFFFLTVKEAVHGIDKIKFPVFYFRSLIEKLTVVENIQNMRFFFRGLMDTVKIESEEKYGRINTQKISEIVCPAGTASRGLILLVRIVTGVFIRDYLLGRFLKAKQELVLKSYVCIEIVLESKIY
jgi:hypothetical protein